MPENKMRKIKIEKVTLNIGCGGEKQEIEKAQKLLEMLTKRKAVVTNSRRRSTFGIAKGRPVGVKVTLRGDDAEKFFSDALKSADNVVRSSQIDRNGNISFGVKEYIDLPNIRYSPDIGMMGLDVVVTLERPGYRTKRRRIGKREIPAKHKVNKDDTANWLKERGVKVE